MHQAPPDISLRLFPHLILAKRPRNDRLFPKALIAWLLPTWLANRQNKHWWPEKSSTSFRDLWWEAFDAKGNGQELGRGWEWVRAGHWCCLPPKSLLVLPWSPVPCTNCGGQPCGPIPTPLPVLQPVHTEILCYLQDFLRPKGFEIKFGRFFLWMLPQCVFLCEGFCVTQWHASYLKYFHCWQNKSALPAVALSLLGENGKGALNINAAYFLLPWRLLCGWSLPSQSSRLSFFSYDDRGQKGPLTRQWGT